MKNLSLLLTFLLLFISCQSDDAIFSHHISGRTMGTTYSVKFLAPKNYKRDILKAVIDSRLRKLNESMSTYMVDSEISTFNKSKKGTVQKFSADFWTVFSHAVEVSFKSNGIFDPTIGPLVNLWGFGPTGERKVPSKEKIREALKLVGVRHLEVSSKDKSIAKRIDGVYLDFSASAKGFGVDEIVNLLVNRGLTNAMVEIGGEVRTLGRNLTRPWKIGIESPSTEVIGNKLMRVVTMENFALATSGDYRNFFKKGSKRYSHTINYKSGKPVEDTLASVSVISDTCMDADAWATALMAMGSEKGFQFASKNDMKAMFIYRDGDTLKVRETDSFKVSVK